MKDAREQHADLFSPTLFEQAEAAYREAVRLFEKKEKVPKIEERLKRTNEFLAKAMKNVEIAKLLFPGVMTARKDALRIDAPRHAVTQYKEAAQIFREAALKVEDGDLDAAKKKAKDAEQRFREAELIAIRATTVGNVRRLIGLARNAEAEKHAPQTYKKAKDLIDETEQILNTNRYAGQEVQDKVDKAEYYARLALYLAKQSATIHTDPKLYEAVYLELADSLNQIAAEFNFSAPVDSGFGESLSTILLAVRNLKQEKHSLEVDLADRDRKIADQVKKIDDLTKTINMLKGRAEALAEKEAAQARALAEKEAFEAKITEIEGMFTAAEGTVLRRGNRLILRLHGLTFPVGKADITPQRFGLLTKVQKAIKTFPEAKIAIGGHTDSAGNPEYNQALSERRANAVKDYLIKTIGLAEDQITAVGYGASDPVASNDTEAGRASNRRIDIVISF
jgi:outer membrane protein OmpA-like peptidoglycan-associated protein